MGVPGNQHFLYYNFARNHDRLLVRKSSGSGYTQRTPAMASRIPDHNWSVQQIAPLLE
jgi:hypothetical protein